MATNLRATVQIFDFMEISHQGQGRISQYLSSGDFRSEVVSAISAVGSLLHLRRQDSPAHDRPRLSSPQAQGCAAERTGDHRPEDRAHDGGTDGWKTVAGGDGHVQSRGGARQHLVAGKARQERFQFFVGSTRVYNGEGWQVCAIVPRKEQFSWRPMRCSERGRRDVCRG